MPFALASLLVAAADGCPAGIDREALALEVSEIASVRLETSREELLRAGYVYALGGFQHLVSSNVDVLDALVTHGGAAAAVAACHLVSW